MKMDLPKNVVVILDTLNQEGYEAYAVGGCVRDSLLGRIPPDWDITTSATPQEIKKLFKRTVDTGIEHGTVTVLLEKEAYEVTTYRIDGDYEDARHPKEVTFTANLTEDLKRRDFTINAMAYHPTEDLIDEFDGIKDLAEKRICCVGVAKERFGEDALRILRAVRFAGQLNFTIEEKTGQAIIQLAGQLEKISEERIHTELIKLVMADYPEKVALLWEYPIAEVIFPWLADLEKGKKEALLRVLPLCPKNKHLRLAALFSVAVDNREKTKQILRQLKLDNETIDRVSTLVQWRKDEPVIESAQIRRTMHRIGPDFYPDLLLLKRAFARAEGEAEKEQYLDRYQEETERIQREKECLSLKELAVTGKDLIEEGFSAGKEMGYLLEELLDAVLENPQKNNKEELIFLAKSLKKE